jgi:hypothetical protein
LSLVQQLGHGMRIARPEDLLQSERACSDDVGDTENLASRRRRHVGLDRRTIVLLHELAHTAARRLHAPKAVRRRVLFNPIMWFAARQMRMSASMQRRSCSTPVRE